MSTYSTNLRLELIGTGEQQGTWGATTNVNLGTLLEEAIGGYTAVAVTDGADTTLTTANGSADQSRNMTLNLTGALTAARNVICPAIEKVYIVKNSTTGGFAVTFKVTGQTGVSIPNGSTVIVYVDGTDARLVSQFPVPVTQGGTGATASTGTGNTVLSASPTFTGAPLSTTAAVDTNTTQIATTAYVVAQASSTTPVVNGTAAVGTSLRYARGDHVHPTDTTRAPLSSPGLTGTPTAPTAAVDTNTTQLATTAYVVGQGYLKSATATSTYAPLASPGLTGTPTAPTAGGGTNTTQIATTAFVQTALGGAGGMTLLGTIATTSGTSQSLSGLTLTSYKQLVLVFQDVSHNDSGTQRQILLGTSTADDVVMTVTEPSTTAFTGIAWVDLNAGIGAAFVRTTNPAGIDTAITTASTSVSVAMSGGSFDAGNVRVYGVK